MECLTQAQLQLHYQSNRHPWEIRMYGFEKESNVDMWQCEQTKANKLKANTLGAYSHTDV